MTHGILAILACSLFLAGCETQPGATVSAVPETDVIHLAPGDQFLHLERTGGLISHRWQDITVTTRPPEDPPRTYKVIRVGTPRDSSKNKIRNIHLITVIEH